MTVYDNGVTSFLLQEVEDLGNFIEYEEDEDIANLTPEEKIEVLISRLNNLGIKLGDDYSCKKMYLKLFKS